MIDNARSKAVVVAAPVAGALAVVPGFAFAAEGDTSAIQTAVTNMATTVANDGVSMIGAVLPVIAPLLAAVIVATLGVKFVRRFSR